MRKTGGGGEEVGGGSYRSKREIFFCSESLVFETLLVGNSSCTLLSLCTVVVVTLRQRAESGWYRMTEEEAKGERKQKKQLECGNRDPGSAWLFIYTVQNKTLQTVSHGTVETSNLRLNTEQTWKETLFSPQYPGQTLLHRSPRFLFWMWEEISTWLHKFTSDCSYVSLYLFINSRAPE